ncbi:hypothetical protein JYK11_24895, partial [Shigella dysenteriae]|uniref:hypothetical protein n=1 Tax=Shigella dysenteriae TaxID=622 RepID=UPI0019D034F8
NGSREYLLLSGNSSFVSINIDGRDCCQTGQFSQDVADGALTFRANTDVLKGFQTIERYGAPILNMLSIVAH